MAKNSFAAEVTFKILNSCWNIPCNFADHPLSFFCFSTYIPLLLILFHPLSFLFFFELHFSLTFPTKCNKSKTQCDRNDSLNDSLISVLAKIKNIDFSDTYAFSSNSGFTIITWVSWIKNYNGNYYVK